MKGRFEKIVTGNLKHFPAKCANPQIATARQFLDAVAEIPEKRR
jgi:hypothetical protein